jgi:hypothetical protein
VNHQEEEAVTTPSQLEAAEPEAPPPEVTEAVVAASAAVQVDRRALVAVGRRHPATVALIEEISDQVMALSARRIDLATAELREEFSRGGGLFSRRDLMTIGAFATVNLLLVTIVLALGRVMTPWIAGLLVSMLTFGGFATAIRKSATRSEGLSFMRRWGARRFVQRLFAST